ncbi:hypothetical protein, partial [Helicobacter pylori]|uniref:hypothetical protein n=1 Tax=Helicobacter pylori TaxID=210 RepID=UPI00112B0B2C
PSSSALDNEAMRERESKRDFLIFMVFPFNRFLLVSHSHDSHVYEISPFYHKMLIFSLEFIF